MSRFLLQRGPEDVGDVQLGAFANEGDDLGLAVEQGLDDGVVLDGDAGLSGAGEGGDAGVVEVERAGRARRTRRPWDWSRASHPR